MEENRDYNIHKSEALQNRLFDKRTLRNIKAFNIRHYLEKIMFEL